MRPGCRLKRTGALSSSPLDPEALLQRIQVCHPWLRSIYGYAIVSVAIQEPHCGFPIQQKPQGKSHCVLANSDHLSLHFCFSTKAWVPSYCANLQSSRLPAVSCIRGLASHFRGLGANTAECIFSQRPGCQAFGPTSYLDTS